MGSPSLLERFTNYPRKQSTRGLHDYSHMTQSDFDMQELDPRPDQRPNDRELSPNKPASTASRRASETSWSGRASSEGPGYRTKTRTRFAGPPPPIAPPLALENSPRHSASNSREGSRRRGPSGANRTSDSKLLSHHGTEKASYRSDSVWRGLRRREKALEDDVQRLLDLQAAGLVAGSEGLSDAGGSDVDTLSDTGSHTPTGTFYSTATSRSRMPSSLYVPSRSTPDGNVIPVRQPAQGRKPGLRSARSGLRRSMAALANLKHEENDHVGKALAMRKQALKQLSAVSNRRDGIRSELLAFEEDEEEPLGQELRELGTAHDSLDEEIRRLEEQLMGMRNRRGWLREKMDDIENKREAGLSGYRGALKDAESDVAILLRHPPIHPLDMEAVSQANVAESELLTSGVEYMSLIPDRRTTEMARSWWEGEVAVLESRKARIESDGQALEEGSIIWVEAVTLVTSFEASLRQLMKPGGVSNLAASSANGKAKVPTEEEVIQDQISKMDEVVQKLESCVHLAEEKHWNLLICAIGAELEAFKEAQDMLTSLIARPDTAPSESTAESPHEDQQNKEATGEINDESDNEVPQDLLTSHMEEPSGRDSSADADEDPKPRYADSEDEVPTEYSIEPDKEKEI